MPLKTKLLRKVPAQINGKEPSRYVHLNALGKEVVVPLVHLPQHNAASTEVAPSTEILLSQLFQHLRAQTRRFHHQLTNTTSQ